MALASGLKGFTAPHAGRDLRHDLGFLPAIWADDDDLIVVDDVEAAREAMRHLPFGLHGKLVDHEQLKRLMEARNPFVPLHLDPWGWDQAVAHTLVKLGVPANRMPDETKLGSLRRIASREWAAVKMLPDFRKIRNTKGEAFRMTSLNEVKKGVKALGKCVLKSPWSCSGRGVRYVEQGQLTASLTGWIVNVIERQGCIMLEPYYNKVLDFGMEFEIDAWGHVHYLGLSLFSTANGAYTGNVIDTEESKLETLTKYIPLQLVKAVETKATKLLTEKVGDTYRGPLGIDMMVIRPDSDTQQNNLIHPCVEVNFRRTMGHVALELRKLLPNRPHVMRVTYTNKYRLQVTPLIVSIDEEHESNKGNGQNAHEHE